MADSQGDVRENVNTITAEDGTTWVEIASTGTENEASLIQGFLEAEGIPAQVENVKFQMEPINFGAMGEIRVYVSADDEVRAQQMLRDRDRQAEQLDDDEETLVTDEGPATIDVSAQADPQSGAPVPPEGDSQVERENHADLNPESDHGATR